MDDFKPEEELKPDASDRPAVRNRKPTSLNKLPLSKQHMMITVGILVLLVLVLAIGSALTSSSSEKGAKTSASARDEGKSIDLGNQSSSENVSASGVMDNAAMSNTANYRAPNPNSSTLMPDIAHSNMPATIQSVPGDDISLPVSKATLDRNASLAGSSNQSASVQGASASAVVSPARPTTSTTAHRHEQAHAVKKVPMHHASIPVKTEPAPTAAGTPTHHRNAERASPHNAGRNPTKPVGSSQPVILSQSVTGHGYTLQLSAASRADTLQSWARQQKLSGYQVVKTTRNGQPWYVLVQGNYATPAAAKQAISTLPEAAQAKSPWVKPMNQLKKEADQ